jgi:hypothetical protein
MPDTRQHRGPHPADAELFAETYWPTLRTAVAHVSWLLTRGYAFNATGKLVGDRFQLTQRQRLAVMRSACSDAARDDRHRRQIPCESLTGVPIEIDGFNLLTTIEAALSGGVILRGRDGCDRDLASMHGNYRKVAETRPALQVIGETLDECHAGSCVWWLDRPVSNSGRLSTIIRDVASKAGWDWDVRLVDDPDSVLVRTEAVIVSSDSVVVDGCRRWTNLARRVIERHIPNALVIWLGEAAAED